MMGRQKPEMMVQEPRHPRTFFETYLNEQMGGRRNTNHAPPSVSRVAVLLPLSALGINQRSHIYTCFDLLYTRVGVSCYPARNDNRVPPKY